MRKTDLQRLKRKYGIGDNGDPTALDFIWNVITDNPLDPVASVVDTQTNPSTQYTGQDLSNPNNPTASDLFTTGASEIPAAAGSAAGSVVSNVAGGFLGGLFKTAWPWLLGAGVVTYVAVSPKAQKALGIGSTKITALSANNIIGYTVAAVIGGIVVNTLFPLNVISSAGQTSQSNTPPNNQPVPNSFSQN
jgi:hypothetical protein